MYDEDFGTYNGDTEHDMMVDYGYHQNTGELPEYFDDENLEDYVDSLDDWD